MRRARRERLRSAALVGDLPAVLRIAREAAELTLREVVGRLEQVGVATSTSTLSAWETGRQTPARANSVDVLRELNDLYELPPRFLDDVRAGRAVRSGTPRPDPPTDEVARLYSRLGGQAPFRTVSLHEFHHVGEDRRPYKHRTRHLIQAGDEPLERYLHGTDAATMDSMAHVAAVFGCRVGRFVADGDQRVVALEFAPPVQPHRTRLFEYETTLAHHCTPPPWYGRTVRADIRTLVIRICFASRALPTAVWRVVWGRSGQGVPRMVEELPLVDDEVHVSIPDPTPKVFHGVRWAWPRDEDSRRS